MLSPAGRAPTIFRYLSRWAWVSFARGAVSCVIARWAGSYGVSFALAGPARDTAVLTVTRCYRPLGGLLRGIGGSGPSPRYRGVNSHEMLSPAGRAPTRYLSRCGSGPSPRYRGANSHEMLSPAGRAPTGYLSRCGSSLLCYRPLGGLLRVLLAAGWRRQLRNGSAVSTLISFRTMSERTWDTPGRRKMKSSRKRL